MKVAVLISGQPRFTKEFDYFLDNTFGYDQMDFFFYLWDTWPKTDQRIPSTWSNDEAVAIEKINKNLPENCKVAKLKITSPPLYTPDPTLRLTQWSFPVDMWYQWYGLKMVNTLRLDYEKENGKYDLVIRARPDVGIRHPLNLTEVHTHVKQFPKDIITPANRRVGMYIPVNDWFGIGTGEAIDVWCSLVDNVDKYHNTTSLPYTCETFLGYHLSVNEIKLPVTNIDAIFREFCESQGPLNDHGRWQ